MDQKTEACSRDTGIGNQYTHTHVHTYVYKHIHMHAHKPRSAPTGLFSAQGE